MNIGWPQLLILALLLVGTGVQLAKHGEPRGGKHSFWVALISDAILIGLLYWGGFFTKLT